MTELEIIKKLFRFTKKSSDFSLATYRSYFFDFWESDYLTFTKARRLHEFEVKRNRSDFLKDKHKVLKWAMISRDRKSLMGIVKSKNRLGEKLLIAFEALNMPNYFWYACPHGVIRPEDIPEKFGLVYVSTSGVRVIREAKVLHFREFSHCSVAFRFANSLIHRVLKGNTNLHAL